MANSVRHVLQVRSDEWLGDPGGDWIGDDGAENTGDEGDDGNEKEDCGDKLLGELGDAGALDTTIAELDVGTLDIFITELDDGTVDNNIAELDIGELDNIVAELDTITAELVVVLDNTIAELEGVEVRWTYGIGEYVALFLVLYRWMFLSCRVRTGVEENVWPQPRQTSGESPSEEWVGTTLELACKTISC